jgi:hypothetical protein
MAEIRLALINGTGPSGPLYDEVMRNSFCHQLGRKLGSRSFYLRGPSLLGLQVRAEAAAAHRWLKAAHDADPTSRLMLAGYSRGGSAAIMACEMLERDGVSVDSLFLFDAVARDEFSGGKVIPANVGFSRHARRSLEADFVAKYEGTLARVGMLGGFENPIRPLFGNVGLTWLGDGDHQPAECFMGSHGALGGIGWRFVVEDSDCEHAVARWMSGHMQSRGVDAALDAFAPAGAAKATAPDELEKWLTHNIYRFVLPESEPDQAVVAGDAPTIGQPALASRPATLG